MFGLWMSRYVADNWVCGPATRRNLNSVGPSRLTVSLVPINACQRSTGTLVQSRATASGVSNPAPVINAAAVSPKTLKVGSYVVGWYVFNIVFNILNKSCLNVFPAPWFLATFQLCASATFMVAMWMTGIQRRPQVSKELLLALIPVAFWHTVGHVSAALRSLRLPCRSHTWSNLPSPF